MSYTFYHLLHLISVFLYVALTFVAIANPDPAKRKRMLRDSGILALLALVSGFGLLGVMKLGFPLWSIVKLVCWLLISVLLGMAFRKPEKAPMLNLLTVLTVIAALVMVALKPF